MRIAECVGGSAYPVVGISLDGKVRNNVFVLHALSRVAHSQQVRHLDVFPAILILFTYATTAFTEACVANLAFRHQYLTTCCSNSLGHVGACFLRDALVALAVVVGANVKDGMIFAVVPLNQFVVFLDEREEAVSAFLQFLALIHLRQQPAT